MSRRARSTGSVPIRAGSQMWNSAGALAARAWLTARSLPTPSLPRWHANVLLGVTDTPPEPDIDQTGGTCFRIEIYSEEWGFFFSYGRSASWIRITDVPFVHGRDDFGLLSLTPALKDIGHLIRICERQYKLAFRRDRAVIITNLPDADRTLRAWVAAL